MNVSKKLSKRIALFLVALMLAIIPNMEVYSAIGSYQNTSQAITANQVGIEYNNPDVAFTTVALVVAVAVYVVMDNLIIEVSGNGGDTDEIFDLSKRHNHRSTDFSQFDN